MMNRNLLFGLLATAGLALTAQIFLRNLGIKE